jgi:hypothetical protein
MAAAPDLLEALEDMVERFELSEGYGSDSAAIILKDAHAAIAKARTGT